MTSPAGALPDTVELAGADLGRTDLEARHADATLIRYQPHGSRLPIVLVRTWPDEVVKHAALARALGPEQPIVSVASRISENDYPRTVDEWSDRVIELARTNLDGGRAVLGGWSFGGVIALEIADRLRSRGVEIERVLLLDSALPRTHERRRAGTAHETARRVVRILDLHPPGRRRRQRLRQAARHAPAAWARWTRRRVRWIASRAGRVGAVGPTGSFDRTSMSPRKRAIWTAYLKYRPEPSDLPVTVLATDDSRRSSGGDLSLGWGRVLVGDVDLRPVDGDHYSMFDPDHIEALALRVADVMGPVAPPAIDLTSSGPAGSCAKGSPVSSQDVVGGGPG